jgi:hypothetical protein
MSHVLYPEALPLTCVTASVAILRNGEAAQRKDELGLHLWNIQGFAQRHLLGVPGDERRFATAPLSDEACCSLDELADLLESYEPTSSGEEPEAALDPITILAIVSTVIQVIRLLRNR